MSDTHNLAVEMYKYLRLRAVVEGVPFELSVSFLEEMIPKTSKIYGIVHDGTRMVRDTQEPWTGFLKEALLTKKMQKLDAIWKLLKEGNRRDEWEEAHLLELVEQVVNSEVDLDSKQLQKMIDDHNKGIGI